MEVSTTTLSAGAVLKNLSYVVVVVISGYLHITAISVVVLASFIVVDIITGIAKAAVLYGGKNIKSSIWQRGLIAKLLLISLPLMVAVAGKGAGFDLSMVAQDSLNVLIFSELYSIIGNVQAIKTGEEKREFDAVAYLIERMKTMLKRFVIIDD